jgi:excinuclease ABC subunit B
MHLSYICAHVLKKNKETVDSLIKNIVRSNSGAIYWCARVTVFTQRGNRKRIRVKRKHIEAAAKELDFIVAAKLRDEIAALREKL